MDFFEANQFALIDCTALPNSVVFKETVSPSTVTGKWMTDANGVVTTRQNNALRSSIDEWAVSDPARNSQGMGAPNIFHRLHSANPPTGPQVRVGSIWMNTTTGAHYLCRGFYNGVPSWMPVGECEVRR